MNFEKRFGKLARDVGATKDSTEVFFGLFSRYSESRRGYHNIHHIESGLLEFDSARHVAENPNAVEFGWWYHDAIYDPERKDNEEKSVELMEKDCVRLGIPGRFAENTWRLIRATKHDFIPQGNDEKLIVDIDLSILGSPAELFDAYEQAVRAEYWNVPWKVFRAGRSKVLSAFLERDGIYLTDFFKEKYEAQAQKNLRRSIAALSG